MRKPRDFDAELQALTDKAKALKSKKQGQLGELVIATGADALSIEQRSALTQRERRRGARAARHSFARAAPALAVALAATRAALRRAVQARNRLQAKRARHDTRAWQVKRRERTRQLIELGGLVAKADLVELTGDDRAVILGLLVEAAATLRGEARERQLTLWRRRGQRAFGSAIIE
jgi:hypothetical protein